MISDLMKWKGMTREEVEAEVSKVHDEYGTTFLRKLEALHFITPQVRLMQASAQAWVAAERSR